MSLALTHVFCRYICDIGRYVRVGPSKCVHLSTLTVIGDEILKGHVQDTNSHYLCHQLWLLGIRVGKVATVADSRDEIADEVRRFAAAYDYVLTTGGVGATHDDVTMEGEFVSSYLVWG